MAKCHEKDQDSGLKVWKTEIVKCFEGLTQESEFQSVGIRQLSNNIQKMYNNTFGFQKEKLPKQ